MQNWKFEKHSSKKQLIDKEMADSQEIADSTKNKIAQGEEEILDRLQKHNEEVARELQYKENEPGYIKLLSKYKTIWDKIRKLERRYKTIADPEVGTAVRVLELERHQIHLEALEIGQKMGKGSNEVVADILNNEGSLSELGLPEFTIFDLNAFLSNDTESWTYGENFGIKRGGITHLIYNLKESTIGHQWSFRPNIPKLYDRVIQRRVDLMSGELGLELDKFSDGFSHERNHTVYCIAVPDSRLEEIAKLIWSSPDKYRIGFDFFSDIEKAGAIEEYKKDLRIFFSNSEFSRETDAQHLVDYVKKHGTKKEVELAEEALKAYLKSFR